MSYSFPAAARNPAARKWCTPVPPERQTAQQAAQRGAKRQNVADFHARGFCEVPCIFWLVEMEDKVIGAQTRYVAIDVELLERIVEGIGEKNALRLVRFQTCCSQSDR